MATEPTPAQSLGESSASPEARDESVADDGQPELSVFEMLDIRDEIARESEKRRSMDFLRYGIDDSNDCLVEIPELPEEELTSVKRWAKSKDSSPIVPAEFVAKRRRGRGKRLERLNDQAKDKRTFSPAQRLLLLDAWRRSGLPAGDLAVLVGISKHTLYKWNQQFEQLGPSGLMDQPRGAPRGGKLPDLTKLTILMLKESHPEWG